MNRGDGLDERLRDVCAEVGVAFGNISPSVRARMQLLADRTQTIEDCTRIAGLAKTIFDYYEQHKPHARFNQIEKRIVVVGSLFADVGKTGPAHADIHGQQLIVDMFSIEGVRDVQQPVAQFLAAYFPNDAVTRLKQFEALGLDSQMPMRAFWNLHTGWTFDIVRDGGVPEEAVAAAATHHLLDNINPQAIVNEDGRFNVDFGDNVGFDRAEKLVIVLDKYDALLRRGQRTHAQAIAWIRDLLDRHPTFRTDAEFATLVADLDAVFGAHALAPV